MDKEDRIQHCNIVSNPKGACKNIPLECNKFTPTEVRVCVCAMIAFGPMCECADK